jgi:N-acetylglutamate synthase-like GNAT family acetyltransferase
MEQLIVRRATAADKTAVVEFCSKIWEGWDYLPRVYDRWLEDARGAFLVAELNGRPVGTDKITVLSPGEVWLEGLRVDPDVRGQGVALAINHKAMEIVAGLEPETVRFGTVSDNQASRHMGEKDGFRLIFQCQRMVSEKLTGELSQEMVARQEDLDAIMAFLKGSENLRRMSGLFAWGWTFKEMSPDFVGHVLAEQGACVIRNGGRIEALALFLPQRHGPRICLGFIDGDREEMLKLALQFRMAAGPKGADELFAMVPDRAVAVLSQAGFRQEYPIEVVVYELGGKRLRTALERVSGG